MMSEKFRVARSLARRLAASGIALAWSIPAHAQTPAEAISNDDGQEAVIVVTAQRRAERLEEVPMSVEALAAEDLENQGVFDFDNLTRATTGIRISRTGVFTQPAIRGISTATLGAGQENNVATYVDGFYQPDQLTLSGDLVGIANVQILKGPQGALYGRNATGGAILVNTIDPNTDRLEGSAHFSYGRYDDRKADALINVPIGENAAFNIVGNYRKTDGYIRDVTGIYPGTGSPTVPPPYAQDRNIGYVKDWGLRAKFRLELSEDTSITLTYRHREFADNRAGSFFMTDYPIFGPDEGTGFGIDGYDYVSQSVPTVNDIKLDEVTMKGVFGLGLGTLTTYTSYTKQTANFNADYDGSKIDFVQAGGFFPRKTFQQAADFAITSVDRLDLVVGAHYIDDKASGTSDTVLEGTLVSSVKNSLDTKAWAIFADGTYELSDRLFLTLGGRYSSEVKRFSSIFNCCGLEGIELFPGTRRAKFTNFTPRGVIRYELAPQTNIYASISRGFKSGTFNSVGSTPATVGIPPVQPEKITAYEIGFKTAQNTFRIEAAAYYYDYTNLQLTRLFITDTGVDQSLENAATAEIYGLELSTDWFPVEALTLSAAIAYNHARYKDFADGAASLPVGGFITSASQDFSGRRIPRAPDWTANLSADYRIPIGEGEVALNGSVFHSSKFEPTTPSYDPDSGEPLFSQPGYTQVNASVTWHAPNDRFEIGAFVNNIFNERYRIWYNATALGAWYVLSEPTVYGLRAGVNF